MKSQHSHAYPSEWERIIRLDQVPDDAITIDADEAELKALAERFGLERIHTLSAKIALDLDGVTVNASGMLSASFDQLCAISGEPFGNSVEEQIALRFVPEQNDEIESDEEIELDETALDEIAYSGKSFDLGEALAQSLGLAIDPYAEGPNAEVARSSGLIGNDEPSGPFAALAALKKR